jgi:DNA-binding GntR family transcriptional regulator
MRLLIKNNNTIRKRVYQHIREEILTGKIGPHERLIEAKIAKDIGTSRTPVREALHSLELEKLVRSIPRVGYVVEDMSPTDVEQLCEIRATIEGLAARWAMEKAAEKLVRELQKLIRRQERAIVKGALRSYAEIDGQFHEAIARLSGSERLLELSQALRQHMLRYRFQCISEKDTVVRSFAGHKRILEAMERNDREAVMREIETHLSEAKNDILRYVFPDSDGRG